MRSRTIKPGYFLNADLLGLPPLVRILFAGLWCLADREGRLPDRPRHIKIAVLPGDDMDADAALQLLHDTGFIRRYETSCGCFIEITNFLKHQRPHPREAASTIPSPEDCQS